MGWPLATPARAGEGVWVWVNVLVCPLCIRAGVCRPAVIPERNDSSSGDTNNQKQMFKTTGKGRGSGSPGKGRVFLVGEIREDAQRRRLLNHP